MQLRSRKIETRVSSSAIKRRSTNVKFDYKCYKRYYHQDDVSDCVRQFWANQEMEIFPARDLVSVLSPISEISSDKTSGQNSQVENSEETKNKEIDESYTCFLTEKCTLKIIRCKVEKDTFMAALGLIRKLPIS